MSETKPYLLIYTPGPQPPVVITKIGPLHYTEREDFDDEEEAVARAEELWTNGTGHNFLLYTNVKDGTSAMALMGYSDFEGYFRRRKWQADD
jgi:hypothetical protein